MRHPSRSVLLAAAFAVVPGCASTGAGFFTSLSERALNG